MTERTFDIFGKKYRTRTQRGRKEPADAPRLVIVGFQPNPVAQEILRLCIDSIRAFTPEPHEIWIIENGSPPEYSRWLEGEKDLNVVFSEPPKPAWGWAGKVLKLPDHRYSGSFANAVALEIGARAINPDSKLMMALHMDTVVCRIGWLSYLAGKISGNVRASGMWLGLTRVRALHILGMMFDFSLFEPLQLSFRHDMPRYDVGDAISVDLENAGYELFACPDSYHQPEIFDRLPRDPPYASLNVNHSLDDQGNVIFMHLARGILKSTSGTPEGKTTPQAWLEFGRKFLLAHKTE